MMPEEITTQSNPNVEIDPVVDSIKVTKNSKGYNWELKLVEKKDRNLEQMFEIISLYKAKLNRLLKDEDESQ